MPTWARERIEVELPFQCVHLHALSHDVPRATAGRGARRGPRRGDQRPAAGRHGRAGGVEPVEPQLRRRGLGSGPDRPADPGDLRRHPARPVPAHLLPGGAARLGPRRPQPPGGRVGRTERRDRGLVRRRTVLFVLLFGRAERRRGKVRGNRWGQWLLVTSRPPGTVSTSAPSMNTAPMNTVLANTVLANTAPTGALSATAPPRP